MKIARSVTRLHSRSGAFARDLLMIPVAWLGAFWLRFNLDSIPAGFLDQALRLLPVIVVIQSAAFLYFGLYRGVWRFASLPDLVRVLQAFAVGTVVCAFATFLLTRLALVPRASFPRLLQCAVQGAILWRVRIPPGNRRSGRSRSERSMEATTGTEALR